MNLSLNQTLRTGLLFVGLGFLSACGAQDVEPVDAPEVENADIAEPEAESAEVAVDAELGCAAFDNDERFLPAADLVAAMSDPDCAAGQDLLFVDARPQLDYEFGHIPGAINVPYFNVAAFVDELPRDRWLIVYCECPHAEAVQAADALTSESNGFTMVKVIDEGLGGWRDLGGEIETGGEGASEEG